MRFLALTPFQAFLLAAVTAGTVIALYFLKLRHRRVFISSSMLWQRVLDERVKHSVRERLRRIISIALAVTIALLIALSLGRPQIEWLTGRTQRIAIVLDTSPSMNAKTADGSTRWQHAVARAGALIDGAGPAAELRVADTSGETAFPFTTDRAEAHANLSKLSPQGTEPEFPVLDTRNSTVYFISDGVGLRNVPDFAHRISVFEPADNVAITAFEVRPVPVNPLGYEAWLEVHNYGKASEVKLSISGSAKDNITRNLRLRANDTFKELFDLTGFQGGAVTARIETNNDALAADNVAFAYLPIKRRTRTLLVTRGNTYLETLLKVNRYVDLQTTTPDKYRETPDIDSYVFDRFAPPTAPSKPAFIVGVTAVDWLRTPQGEVRKPSITTWADNHPLMQYVPVHDISIERAAKIDASNLTVIASSNDTPLIVASEKPRWVMLTFDLNSSDFALQTGFPVFVENVLAWFNREQLAVRRAPGEIEIPLANAEVRTADGKVVPSNTQLGATVFHVDDPGLYIATAGDARLPIAAHLTNPDLSNINRSALKETSVALPPTSWLHQELWVYMVLAALILISVEWFTYHRRITL
jgi:Aerotolerance regulator N-terminal